MLCPPIPLAALSAPLASRTLSQQFESAGIPAMPGGQALGEQRAAAVLALKQAAVERRLPMVSVPLGTAGEPQLVHLLGQAVGC